MAVSTNMPQVVARNGAITFLVCLCMNMTPFLYVWVERPDESHEDLEPKGWSLG
jgi:hypothetical protein